jgi:hypothetical protein
MDQPHHVAKGLLGMKGVTSWLHTGIALAHRPVVHLVSCLARECGRLRLCSTMIGMHVQLPVACYW